MIVKVGEQKVDSTEHPIIVEFTEDELNQIRNFDPEQNILYSYPADANEEVVEAWATRRINEDYEEDESTVAIHEGNGD